MSRLPSSFPRYLKPYSMVEVVTGNPRPGVATVQYGVVDKFGRSMYHSPEKSDAQEVFRRANATKKGS